MGKQSKETNDSKESYGGKKIGRGGISNERMGKDKKKY
jgi:hypothetical protein